MRVAGIPRAWRVRWTVAAMIIARLTCLAVVAATAQSGDRGDGHAQNHEQYRDWTQEFPNKMGKKLSCCNDGDCRPVRAEVDENGEWRWWNGFMWSEPVPKSAMLKPDKLGDGRSHACGPATFKGGIQRTYCFSPAEPKF